MSYVRLNKKLWFDESYQRGFALHLDVYLDMALSELEAHRNLQLYFTEEVIK